MKRLDTIIRDKQKDARKNGLATLASYTLIISEIDRLKGNKDPWTKTLQIGEPSDEVVIKVMERLMKSELERVQFGGTPDTSLQFVLLTHLPKIEVMSQQDLEGWVLGHINFESLKSPMQAIGITKKELGDRADTETLKKIVQGLMNKK